MSEDMYIKLSLTKEELFDIVNQVVDAATNSVGRPVVVEKSTTKEKPMVKVRKMVTTVSNR